MVFPMLSDFKTREVSKAYGVLNEGAGLANRTTFVVDKEGKIQHIEEGMAVVDVTGAALPDGTGRERNQQVAIGIAASVCRKRIAASRGQFESPKGNPLHGRLPAERNQTVTVGA